MGKYQRPCAVLTKREVVEEIYNAQFHYTTYEGSARGCDAKGVYEFKDICEATGLTEYVAGHQGAFGLGLKEENLENFTIACDRALQDMPDEQIHYVDYIYKGNTVNEEQLLDITNLSNLYGKDINESYVAVEKIKVTSDMVQVYVKKNNTLKITLPNKIALIFFDADQDLCDQLRDTKGYVEMNIVGIPNKNEYMG